MKIAILTSGGDSPGMNSLLTNLVHFGLKNNHELYLINDGYYGLTNSKFLEIKDDIEILSYRWNSGSYIGCSRYPEFVNLVEKAVENLQKHKIDCVCAIGGNGTFEGAKLLNKYIRTFFFPATIDNDVWFSDYCLGYGSALQEIIDSAKKLEATFKTHKNIIFTEIMGRYCNDLLINCNKAMSLGLMISNEKKLNKFEIKELISEFYKKYNYAFIFVIEKLYEKNEIDEIIKYLENEFKASVRYQILGYTQRGANVVFDDLLFSFDLTNKFYNIVNRQNLGGALFKKNNEIEFKEYGQLENESFK